MANCHQKQNPFGIGKLVVLYMEILKGMIFTKDCIFCPGIVIIEDDIIKEVQICKREELSPEEQKQYLLPGLIDVHFHGAAGYDFCDGTGEAYRAIEKYENEHGITSICPATMTLPVDELKTIVRNASKCGLHSLVGIHLEGPFISKEKKGAQKEDYIISPKKEILQDLQQEADGLIKIVSIAPETEGAILCIEEMQENFHFSIAHTTADYETADKAFEAGADHVTHLYNAMPVSTHREPSVLGAAADQEHVFVELICDGIHIHPAVVRNTFRIFGESRVILISDSMRATGMSDGSYTLGGQDVNVRGTLATLADGTIAGSVTNLYDCMKTAVSMGIVKETAVRATTINPARSIGIDNTYGSIEKGKKANILFTDENLRLEKVMICGKIVKD